MVLFAALLVPWFINWDHYKVNFEQEATRILGHPVHVGGAAHVSILPSPSLTFTDVEVGDPGAEPIVTVENFAATMELMPLLQGQIRVVSMKLDRPHLRLQAGDAATIDWLQPSVGQKGNPDNVVLGDVQITGGTINFLDPHTGVAVAFGGITASVQADSLAGPWRIDGKYLEGDREVPFRFATGRQLDDGTLRLQSNFTPAQWPVAIAADGVLASAPDMGVTYTGTYSAAEVAAPSGADSAGGNNAVPDGWSSEGTFALSRDRIAIDKAVLSHGPADRATSVAGSLSVDFGKDASFTAAAEARQLDFDRWFGAGPDAPVNVSDAAAGLVTWLGALPLPSIPGRIAFNVPGIVLGGSIIQDVAFTATPAPNGWQMSGLHARLPGQAIVEADGLLTTRDGVGFNGHARLAAAQPAMFAAWWRGGAQAGAGRVLSAFDISGDTVLAPGRVSVRKIDARIGDASISGGFEWGDVRGKRRELSTDLKADRIDFAQVEALADLLIGRDLTDVASLADSFSVRLAADTFLYDDIDVKGVAIDAAYSDDTLNVVQFAVADLGGASFRVTSGRVDELSTNPRGHLDARLEANTFDGLTAIAAKLAPDSGIAAWLAHTAPVMMPSVLNARITAPPKDGSGFLFSVDGVAGQTTFTASLQSTVAPKQASASWRNAAASVTADFESPDSAAIAQQFGFTAQATKDDTGAHIAVKGSGIPEQGLATNLEAEFAGLQAKVDGKLTLAPDTLPGFAGTFALKADDVGQAIAVAGLSIPGAAEGTPLDMAGSIGTAGSEGTLSWKKGTVADRNVAGDVKVARGADGSWRVDGSLGVDAVDLGWLASLSLGFPPAISDNAKTPWSKTGFSPPTYGGLSGKLAVAVDHLAIGDLDVTGGKVAVALQPNRIDVDLTGGHLDGGTAIGGVSLQNVDGNASLTGQFNLTGATLDQLTWARDDRPVLEGAVDLSANFESTGRSPAALVSSMTGGGVVSIHNGVARNINPDTVSAIIRTSDLGETFSDDALGDAVSQQIDGGDFQFGDSGGAFTIASGSVRMSGLSARGPRVRADGGAVVDLNTLSLDSAWTLTFDQPETAADAGDAKIGVAFRGPLSAPARIIDAVPLNAYLSSRQAARMMDVIATEEADRVEHVRLQAQVVKIRLDAAREAKVRQDAIEAARRKVEAEAAAVARVAASHVAREIADDLRVAAIAEAVAERAAQAQADAEKAAAMARVAAADARARANSAATALAAGSKADGDAATAASSAADKFASAQSAAASAAEAAAKADATATALEQGAAAAIAAETTAKAKSDAAAAKSADAVATLNAANGKAADARRAADEAARDAAEKKAALDTASKRLEELFKARDAAADAAAAASTALDNAHKSADSTATAAASAAQAAMQADAERASLQMQANARLAAQHEAEAARDTALVAANTQKAAYAAAQSELEAIAQGAAADGDILAQAKRAAADHAKQTSEIAARGYDEAEAEAAAAASLAAAAQSAAADAEGKSKAATAASDRAAAVNTTAQAMLADRNTKLDVARTAADQSAADAKAAGAAFDDALRKASDAATRAAEAQAAAETAASEQTAAAQASAAVNGSGAAFALQQATAERIKAVSDASAARAAAEAAKVAAANAESAVAAAGAARDEAAAVAAAAHKDLLALQEAATAAASEANREESAAAAAEAVARSKADEAAAAAGRVPSTANVGDKANGASRARAANDALAGEAARNGAPAE